MEGKVHFFISKNILYQNRGKNSQIYLKHFKNAIWAPLCNCWEFYYVVHELNTTFDGYLGNLFLKSV